MYPFHDALYRLDWGFRQHAVAEIEDVPGAACGALEHVAHPPHELREPHHQLVPGPGLGVHETLGQGETTGRAALDRVAREGERGASEADERDLGRERPRRQSHRLHDVREIGDRVHPRQLEDLGRLTNRTGDLRSFAYREAEAETEGLERQQEV